ncbi:antibiotic biosynthesis monooxygenase [Mycobacterium vicinigordonae]|uniref:Antibiotic biosynthesis monooxygenase n=1 Tax=Mycobacterium vicinigordonae TaxID=1719132 RepID=A0A7D6DUI2_9MYCO|nr:antibiotic biosynthesis monooxygenase [Mycobacterium vicinigordonae]QLL05084.1 antibiotic biosynthesis monooxygenase [Mycobacterium vicinigordonae]
MTVGATAITFFHPPADPGQFNQWADAYLDSARDAAGFVSARAAVQRGQQLDCALAITFDSVSTLDSWLDGSERRAMLVQGQPLGCWRCASDLVLAQGEPPPADRGVFLHSVAPGKESEFVVAQRNLTLASTTFPGYEGTALFPPDRDGQWMSVLRFRTAGQLGGWIRSQERQQALPRLRDELSRDFAELPRSAPFGSTVRVADGQTKITPAWKSAMLVVLCLYPTVMLLSRWLAPVLSHLGLQQAPAVFLGNVISVVLLQWVLVPAASRPFRRWLDPIEGESRRISAAGAAVVAVGYAAALLIFTLIG